MHTNQDSNKIWKQSLSHAMNIAQIDISQSTQAYLADILDQNMLNVQFHEIPASTEWLQEQKNHKSTHKVGDKCLIIVGLFPNIAQTTTSIDFYITLGKKAYQHAANRTHTSDTEKKIFNELDEKFISISQTIALIKQPPHN